MEAKNKKIKQNLNTKAGKIARLARVEVSG